MLRQLSVLAIFGLNLTSAVWGQSVPLYRVTVVERTVKAVNYQYRSGPTGLDFRGTVLLPESKGDATVESKAGRTEIDARFSHLPSPARFGGEYLTYVLWAITPEGHPKNLGEIIPGSSDKAHTTVTTDLQAFGLIVTAEPYAAVREPSDVVVMENQVRPDTIGGVEPVQVRYELMPRHGYTYNKPADMKAVESGPMVSMGEYETMLEVYQAQNAVQIAQSSGAAQYAPEVLSKAQSQLQDAQTLRARKADKSLIITAARNAEQTAEDARVLAATRAKSAEIANAQNTAEQERQMRVAAEAQAAQARQQAEQAKSQAQQAQAQASADRMQLEAAQQAQVTPPQPAAPPRIDSSTLAPPPALTPDDRSQRDLRRELAGRLNECLPSRDTPRGLVATVAGADFQGSALEPQAQRSVSQIAVLLMSHPGLTVEVEGNSDTNSPDAERLAMARAEGVRDALIRAGAPAAAVTARSLGMSRPIGPNATANGRAANRRVEIVISGATIGSTAVWDRSYPIGRN